MSTEFQPYSYERPDGKFEYAMNILMAVVNKEKGSMFYIGEYLESSMDLSSLNAAGALQYAYDWVNETGGDMPYDTFYDALCETVRFRFSYCFAVVAKRMTGQGSIYWAAPYGRFVWMGEEGIPYELNTVYDGNELYLIPELYVAHLMPALINVPENVRVIGDRFEAIIRKYENDNKLPNKNIGIPVPKTQALKTYTVSFHASGYNGTFKYRVTARNLEAAKTLWETYVKTNSKIGYAWEQAIKGVKNHYGGYVTWKETDDEGKEQGCCELPYEIWNTGSDHLQD